MTTVDDILKAAKPTVVERAKAAAEAVIEAEKAKHAAEFNDLVGDTVIFLRDELGVSEGDLNEINFRESHRENNNPSCLFKLDGIWFRSRHLRSSSGDVTFKIGFTKSPNALVGTSTWTEFASLALLGRLL